MTAFIGQRLRATLPGIVLTALLVAPAFGAIAILHLAAIFVVPLLLAPLGLAPVAAGGGDGAGISAIRRALTLCGQGGYRRSLVPCAICASFAAIIFLAFGIALSPIGGRARVIATLVLWAAVAWPIAGLMLRSLYGALSGRLVVRFRGSELFTRHVRDRRASRSPLRQSSDGRDARVVLVVRQADLHRMHGARASRREVPRLRAHAAQRARAPQAREGRARDRRVGRRRHRARRRARRAQRHELRLLRLPDRLRRRRRDGRGRDAHERLLPRPRVGRDRGRREPARLRDRLAGDAAAVREPRGSTRAGSRCSSCSARWLPSSPTGAWRERARLASAARAARRRRRARGRRRRAARPPPAAARVGRTACAAATSSRPSRARPATARAAPARAETRSWTTRRRAPRAPRRRCSPGVRSAA